MRGVLDRKFGWSKEKAALALSRIKHRAELVAPSEKISQIREKDSDNRFLECAVEGGAGYIVSGDRQHLQPLKDFRGIKILGPAKFMMLYRAGRLIDPET